MLMILSFSVVDAAPLGLCPLPDYGLHRTRPLSDYAPLGLCPLPDYGLHPDYGLPWDYAPFRSMAPSGTKQSLRRVSNR